MQLIKKTKKYPLKIFDCGISDYEPLLSLQHDLRDQRRKDEIPNTVLLTEHRPVITLGARSGANKLLIEPERLREHNIDLVEIRRGGGATAHNPGQLVLYPIMNLQQLGLGITEYIWQLETIGAELLWQLQLGCQRKKGYPGLWLGRRKIASIGVRVSRFITCHGMAVNIKNDLDIFKFIIPCGLDGISMISAAAETGNRYSMKQIKQKAAKILVKHFSDEDYSAYEKRA